MILTRFLIFSYYFTLNLHKIFIYHIYIIIYILYRYILKPRIVLFILLLFKNIICGYLTLLEYIINFYTGIFYRKIEFNLLLVNKLMPKIVKLINLITKYHYYLLSNKLTDCLCLESFFCIQRFYNIIIELKFNTFNI